VTGQAALEGPVNAGAVTDILVNGKPVIPAKAAGLGYPFAFPTLDSALHDLLSPEPVPAAQGE
jgi:NAD dependent epimerase/dehydratase family enzyme